MQNLHRWLELVLAHFSLVYSFLRLIGHGWLIVQVRRKMKIKSFRSKSNPSRGVVLVLAVKLAVGE